MTVHVVTWNLNKERSNYNQARENFINHLDKNYDNTKDSGLESVRFISTTENASKLARSFARKWTITIGCLSLSWSQVSITGGSVSLFGIGSTSVSECLNLAEIGILRARISAPTPYSAAPPRSR